MPAPKGLKADEPQCPQAVVTGALFVFGVAVKFVIKYGHYKDGKYYERMPVNIC